MVNSQQDVPIDIWRDTKIRLLGYSNEIGESFRYLQPRILIPSYILAFTYMGCDTFDKTYKQFIKDGNQMSKLSYQVCFKTLIWQSLASIIIPSGTIFCVVRSVKIITQNKKIINLIQTEQTLQLLKYTPTLIGLASIPFICGPIDKFTDFLLNIKHEK